MRRRILPLLLVMFSIGLAGCASSDTGPAVTDTGEQPQFRYDDPRCTVEELRAIRAATKAVLGTDRPSEQVADRLHFSITHRSADMWFVAVYQYDPGQAPGSFTGVQMDGDFTVQRLVGGD